MKKLIFAVSILLCSISVKGQHLSKKNIHINAHDLNGRWLCYAYTLELLPDDSLKSSYVYLFKDNNVFHKGKITESAIIFNITGEYSVSGDTVKLYYYDYLNQTVNTRKLQKEFLKVFYNDGNRMDAEVILPKHLLPVTLKRQK